MAWKATLTTRATTVLTKGEQSLGEEGGTSSGPRRAGSTSSFSSLPSFGVVGLGAGISPFTEPFFLSGSIRGISSKKDLAVGDLKDLQSCCHSEQTILTLMDQWCESIISVHRSTSGYLAFNI